MHLAEPWGEVAGDDRAREGRAGEGGTGEGCSEKSRSGAEHGRGGVCADRGGFDSGGGSSMARESEVPEVRWRRGQGGAERCCEAQGVGLGLQGAQAVRGGGEGKLPSAVAEAMRGSIGISASVGRFEGTPHGTLGRETDLDRRLEAALRQGDHAAAQRLNDALMRREHMRRQRQAEWHVQLAASLEEQDLMRHKKRQRLNWGMDVMRKSERKGNM
ncbi:hypothetical protein CLOM_g19954 [Closterium sp. NIES-68]|nr:hypothetical protein CLOM_g19954 [Closterium sp. NIES-68]GJP67144.1 hypothetical protein CLOP_g24005 [Closterium sp. NIES-67]